MFKLVAISLMLIPLTVLAQELPAAPDLAAPLVGGELVDFLKSLKGVSGPMAISLVAAQGLLLAFRAFGFFDKFSQRSGFVLSSSVHVVIAFLTLSVAGVSLVEVSLHSGFMALLGNYLFTGYKMFFDPKKV